MMRTDFNLSINELNGAKAVFFLALSGGAVVASCLDHDVASSHLMFPMPNISSEYFCSAHVTKLFAYSSNVQAAHMMSRKILIFMNLLLLFVQLFLPNVSLQRRRSMDRVP